MDCDLSLLRGFSFGCRPDCGLCCFTEPTVLEPERQRLLQILPELQMPARGWSSHRISSRPNGGACQLLRELRCSAHDRRPFPCRTFPIVVHVGWRAQASLVLSCPGLDLTALTGWVHGSRQAAPQGLDSELAAVRSELELALSEPLLEKVATDMNRTIERLNRRGVDIDLSLSGGPRGAELPDLEGSYPALLPPTVYDGLENLPMTFDQQYGRVALAGESGAWRLFSLREVGGAETELGTYVAPPRPPDLDKGGRALLVGYLRYVLARDLTRGQLLLELEELGEASFEDGLNRTRVEIASDVVTRAAVLAQLHGQTSERLGAEEIANGIRATDAEWVDRPTAGIIL